MDLNTFSFEIHLILIWNLSQSSFVSLLFFPQHHWIRNLQNCVVKNNICLLQWPSVLPVCSSCIIQRGLGQVMWPPAITWQQFCDQWKGGGEAAWGVVHDLWSRGRTETSSLGTLTLLSVLTWLLLFHPITDWNLSASPFMSSGKGWKVTLRCLGGLNNTKTPVNMMDFDFSFERNSSAWPVGALRSYPACCDDKKLRYLKQNIKKILLKNVHKIYLKQNLTVDTQSSNCYTHK